MSHPGEITTQSTHSTLGRGRAGVQGGCGVWRAAGETSRCVAGRASRMPLPPECGWPARHASQLLSRCWHTPGAACWAAGRRFSRCRRLLCQNSELSALVSVPAACCARCGCHQRWPLSGAARGGATHTGAAACRAPGRATLLGAPRSAGARGQTVPVQRQGQGPTKGAPRGRTHPRRRASASGS